MSLLCSASTAAKVLTATFVAGLLVGVVVLTLVLRTTSVPDPSGGGRPCGAAACSSGQAVGNTGEEVTRSWRRT
jgi:hypothetical protein